MTRSPVVFDIGNVLTHFSLEAVSQAMQARTTLPLARVRAILIQHSRPFCLGQCDGDDFARQCLDDLQFQGTAAELKGAYNSGFETNSPMLPVVERLSRSGHALFYLSDTNPWHLDHLLEHEPMLEYFDGGTASYEAGYLKPDPAIYRAAAERHGIEPQDAIFIDDRHPNVAAADGLGFRGIHYLPERHGDFEAMLERRLRETDSSI